MKKEINVNFSYYQPINEQQADFHKSKSEHKLLIGGFRGGKTYPAIHEALFVCYDNPNHEFLIARNTYDCLYENIEKDTIRIGDEANAIAKYKKSDHDCILYNGTVIRFRPLSIELEQFKGMNLCGFLLDDPDVEKYLEIVKFLFTRLTNPPNVKANYFETIICANYEGHNWLWKQYMQGKEEGGDNLFAYWLLKTTDNPTNPQSYIETLKEIHSESWLNRYVYVNLKKAYTGLVYDEFNEKIHIADLSWCFSDNNLIKILAIDVGILHPTVVLKMATDGEKIYIYEEWYRENIRTDDLGNYMRDEILKETVKACIIDPKSGAREQTSGVSPQEILKNDFGIKKIISASNAINPGIEFTKSLLTVRNNETRLLFGKVPYTLKELELYRWATPGIMDYDEVQFKEIPVDKNNNCMDAMRYGCVYLKKYLKIYQLAEQSLEERRKRMWDERYNKLKYYRDQKISRNYELRQIYKINSMALKR